MVFENRDTLSDPLYSSVQRFFLKNSLNDEKHRDLRVTVTFSNSHSKVSKQVLNIQVSDDEDPFFFYSLVLTEDDYQRLKQLQGLLVDFESFPSQVIRLLENCKENESSSSKFLLLLEEENNGVGSVAKTSLKIVETNNFKHLCHLVLQIEPGNDNDIKKLMLQKIKSLKEQNQRAEKCISDLESQLFSKSKYLAAKEEQLHEIEQKWKEDRLLFKAESSKELIEETEKFRKAQLDWQIKAQRDKNELEEKYHSVVKEKDSELSRLRLENQILQEKRSHLELTITEQARRLESLEKELATCRSDFSSLRKQSSKLDADYHEKDKLVNGLKTRLAVAEQESKDMTILMKKQQELLNVANEQKLRLEEVINEKEKNIQRKQGTIQNLTDELVKANEIISKIQKDMTVVSQKLKVRTSIALEQEKVVESNQTKIKELEQILRSKEKKIQSLLESENSLKCSFAELNSTLEIKDKKIKENERLIDWLNRRLTEQSKTCSPNPVQNGLITGATSTPFPRFRSQEAVVGSSLPYSVIQQSPPIDSVRSLDQHKNFQVGVAEKSPVGIDSLNGQTTENTDSSKQPVTPKTAETSNKKTVIPKNVISKASVKTPGFKRRSLQEVQTTSVPSSYFLK